MSRRKRRKSERQAEALEAPEQGDLLSTVGDGEATSGPEPEGWPAPEGEPRPDAAPEPEPEGHAERDAGIRPEPRPGAGPEPPGAEPEQRPEPWSGTEPETRPEPWPEPEPGAGRQLEPEPEPVSPPQAARRSEGVEPVAEQPSEGTKPPPAGERLGRAKDLVQSGRVEEAAELYIAVLTENPTNLKARNNLGALYEALGKHELALEQFEAAVAIEPENVEVLTNLGATMGVLGRYDEAEAELRRALRLSPDNVEVRASLGILFFRRGVYAQAEAELRWVCDQDAGHGAAFFYRGEALNRLGRTDEAMSVLERATVLQPTNAKAFYTLGILYDRKHLPEEAALMYRKARELQRG